jgi:drug/metabolite transporter (DMT)-like permease
MAGVLAGLVFSTEFTFLFIALDLTTVTRTSVIFYSMPVWLALAAHVLLPGEAITPRKAVGLAVAFAGVVWAILDRSAGGEASLLGDLCALAAAMGWAGIVLVARGTRLRELHPEMQLLWQVAVSGPILMVVALFFGPFIRDLQPIHLWGLAFQAVVLVSMGFVLWFWLLSIYPAAGVASFSFLSPIFGFLFGWLLLGEEIGWSLVGALLLVSVGLILINRPAKTPGGQVPQKV